MSIKPFLSIIILNYQTFALTVQTIVSVLAEIERHPAQLGGGQVEIILVDNASPDGSGAQLEKYFASTPLVKYVAAASNAGFSAGNLAGFKVAQGEVIFLLNSDTIVLTDSLAHLMQTLRQNQDRDQGFGVLGCELYNHDDGQIQPQGGDLPSLGTVFTQMSFLDDLPLIGRLLPSVQHTGRRAAGTEKSAYPAERAPISGQIPVAVTSLTAQFPEIKPTVSPQIPPQIRQEFVPTGWVGGTAMVFRRSTIEKTGFLDEKIFMYGEDQEFCYRVHQMLGLKSAVYTAAPIIHYGSASSSSKNAILDEFKGYLYFWKKHKPTWQMPFLKFTLWLGALLRIIIFSIIKPDQTRRAIYREAFGQIWHWSV